MNIIIMKKFEILQELPECGKETWSKQMLENGANRLYLCRAGHKSLIHKISSICTVQ